MNKELGGERERNEGEEWREKRNSFDSMSTETLFSFFILSPSLPPFHFEIPFLPPCSIIWLRTFVREKKRMKEEVMHAKLFPSH